MRPLLLWLMACGSAPEPTAEERGEPLPDTDAPSEHRGPAVLRVATFNTSLHRDAPGELVSDLQAGDAQARTLAAILQEVRPHVVLLNEVDFDDDGLALNLLARDYLGVAQGDREPLTYPYRYLAPVNTGVPSGADLSGDGEVADVPGTDAWGQDARGYGRFPGQYGMAVLSTQPISAVRTFQDLLWKDVPDGLLPTDHYDAEARAVLPLSSKSHWDVTIEADRQIHLLASHPTPPTFDGPEDRNGRRNHDEIRFWVDYVDGGADSWHVDDGGARGGLTDEAFVVVGDLNSDPMDGDSRHEAIQALLDHPRLHQAVAPRSAGGAAAARAQAGTNSEHTGPPGLDTSDFPEPPGNLRVDYVLPSANLSVVDAGVFWPAPGEAGAELVSGGATDHRLVWVDLKLR